MPARLPPAGSASWWACTSSPAPQTTSKKSFRSANTGPPFFARLRAHLHFQFLQCFFISDDQQRLARRAKQIEKLSGLRSCVDFFSVCQQRNRSASSNGVEQPDAE